MEFTVTKTTFGSICAFYVWKIWPFLIFLTQNAVDLNPKSWIEVYIILPVYSVQCGFRIRNAVDAERRGTLSYGTNKRFLYVRRQ
jgi:hypothetical protein